MCKKLAITAAVVIGLVTAFCYTKAGSYARTAWKQVKENTKSQVPIEFEIERLKTEISQLIPDLRKSLSTVAEQMASVDRLEKEITATQNNLDRQKTVLLKMAKDLETPETAFIYDTKAYSRDQVARKMDLDWKSYKIAQSELKTKEQILDAKRRELDAAKAKLDSIRIQERELKLEIAELEADLQNVRLAETKNKFVVDDSRLGEVKKSIAELRFRLDTEKRRAALEGEYFGNEVTTVERVAPRPAVEIAREIRGELEGAKVANDK